MEITSPLQLYKILLRTCRNKQMFPQEKARKFLEEEIKKNFRKYKKEKNQRIIEIQLNRAVNFLSVSIE